MYTYWSQQVNSQCLDLPLKLLVETLRALFNIDASHILVLFVCLFVVVVLLLFFCCCFLFVCFSVCLGFLFFFVFVVVFCCFLVCLLFVCLFFCLCVFCLFLFFVLFCYVCFFWRNNRFQVNCLSNRNVESCFLEYIKYLCQRRTKPTLRCDKRRLWSACASAQSDQSLHLSHMPSTASSLSKLG